jgi:hypothetical protein
MRLAVIAGVHGNAGALEAVLADIRSLGVDRVVNLGDLPSGPPEARYGVLEKRRGAWMVSLRHVAYDHRAASRRAAERRRPDWASALATGWIR